MRTHSDSFSGLNADISPRSVSFSTTHEKRIYPTMASEHSILTDIAARLGIYRLVRDSSSVNAAKESIPPIKKGLPRARSVHEEAELLMNFMTTSTPESADTFFSKAKTPDRRPSNISPSFSFEAEKFRKLCRKEDHPPVVKESLKLDLNITAKKLQLKKDEEQCSNKQDTFVLSCPRLSLKSDFNIVPSNAPSISSPSYLFSRPIKTEPINIYSLAMGDVPDSLANNLVESFNTAMKWQTKTWVKALSRVLSVRYELKKSNMAKAAGPNSEEIDLRSIQDELKESNEARVIGSLTKASSAIFIHDVRTTFSVLEQQLDQRGNTEGEEKKESEMLPSKKRKHISGHATDTTEIQTPYVLSHAIILDTRCSVSTSPMKKMSVCFRTPGVIRGTFVRDCDGNNQLKNVSIDLNTEALAKAMDENCRRVLRSASEEFMVSPPVNYCTIYDTVQEQAMAEEKLPCDDSHCTPEPEENLDSQRFYSDRRYESYFYSPTADAESSYHIVTPTLQNTSSQVALPIQMSIPSRNVNSGGSGSIKSAFLNPRRVSPTEQCVQSGPFDSPTPTKVAFVPNSNRLTTDHQYLVPPSLVSPYISTNDEVDAENAPTMPALLEVARAAHAKCH